MRDWLGDFLRFWWGLLYWNTRKTWFRLGHGHCPCQNRSNSGRALETDCDAAVLWNEPARFRHVCPLLVQLPQGLRCSVDTGQVRPFWGRAAVCYGTALVFGALLALLGTFAGLRLIGYQVPLSLLVWPPAWRQLHEVRAKYFLAQAQSAFERGDASGGLLSLSIASNLAPANYQAGVQLASLWLLSGQEAMANASFAALMDAHPEHRAITAELWFRSLLARGDFPRIINLAGRMLRENRAHRSAWLQALLFASRQANASDPLKKLLAGPRFLPQPLSDVIEGELALRAGRTPAEVPVLARVADDLPEPFAGYYQIDRLIELGFAKEALGLLQRYAPRLGEADAFALRLAAITALGRSEQLIAALNHETLNAKAVELISACLIRRPDPVVFDAFYAAVMRSNLPKTTENKPAYGALFCACGVARDWPRFHVIGGILREICGGRFLALSIIEGFFRDETGAGRPGTFLSALQPLSVDVMYALFERFAPKPPPAGPPR